MNPTSMNNCLYNSFCDKPKRFQCIISNNDDNYDRYFLLTNDQIRMVKYLLNEDMLDSDIYTLIVLDEEGKTFEKV